MQTLKELIMDKPATVEGACIAWGWCWVSFALEKLNIHAWSDAAAMIAFFYSVLLIWRFMREEYRAWRDGTTKR